jgi:hypothetical protein
MGLGLLAKERGGQLLALRTVRGRFLFGNVSCSFGKSSI